MKNDSALKTILIFSLYALINSPVVAASCDYLSFIYSNKKYDTEMGGCLYGTMGKSKTTGLINMAQGTTHGPNCDITIFSIKHPDRFVTFEAQQNFCAFEAGAISVTPRLSPTPLKMDYTVTEGNYFKGIPGVINFHKFIHKPSAPAQTSKSTAKTQ